MILLHKAGDVSEREANSRLAGPAPQNYFYYYSCVNYTKVDKLFQKKIMMQIRWEIEIETLGWGSQGL